MLLIVAGAVVFLAVGRIAVSTQAANEGGSANELEQLRQQVAKLEERVAKLEKRPTLVVPTTAVPGKPVPRVPDDWVQRQFNGQTYWIVPLDTATKVQSKPSVPQPRAK